MGVKSTDMYSSYSKPDTGTLLNRCSISQQHQKNLNSSIQQNYNLTIGLGAAILF